MDGGLEATMDHLVGLDPGAFDDEALHETVVELERLSSRFAAVQAQFVSVWDARCIWADDRSKATGVRLARDARCAPASARAEVRRARKLRTMPSTVGAFASGDLSVDHADVLCAANHDPVTALFARDEAVLVAPSTACSTSRDGSTPSPAPS